MPRRKQEIPSSVLALRVDGDRRITISVQLAHLLEWIKVPHEIEIWLLLVQPGRYRLLLPEQIEEHESLRDLRERILGPRPPDPDIAPYEAEPAESAALQWRLVRTTAAPKEGSGWRIVLPARLPPAWTIGPSDTVHVLVSQGYLEVWSTARLEEALKAPVSDLFR